jgi:hypothetical protein
MRVEQAGSSETLAFKLQTPGIILEESIRQPRIYFDHHQYTNAFSKFSYV